MEYPDSFRRLCRGFHQDVYVGANSLDDVLMSALSYAELTEVRELKAYLDELLSGKHTHQKLLELWSSSPADIYFNEADDLLKVLSRVRELLDIHPAFEAGR